VPAPPAIGPGRRAAVGRRQERFDVVVASARPEHIQQVLIFVEALALIHKQVAPSADEGDEGSGVEVAAAGGE